MGKLFMLLGLVWASVSGAVTPPKTDPVYGQLRNFHTYFAIDRYQSARDNFIIWYQYDGFGSSARVNVDTVAEAAVVKSLGGGFVAGSVRVPSPLPYSAVPASLQAVADAIVKRIGELKPGASDFVVRWMGRYSNFRLLEFIPLDDNSSVFKRFASTAEYDVKIAEKTDKLESDFGMAMTGTSMLCRDYDPKSCVTSPEFVDFSLDSKLEGSALLGAHFFYDKLQTPEYVAAFNAFEKEVIKMVAAKDAGTYANPIADILKRQGTEIIPLDYDQHVIFPVGINAYSKGGGAASFFKRLELRMRTADLVAGTVKLHQRVPEAALDLDISADWKAKTVTVKATLDSGEVISRNMTLQTDRLLVDGKRTAIKSYSLVTSTPKPGEGIRFGAVGSYSGILVSLPPEITVSTLFFDTSN